MQNDLWESILYENLEKHVLSHCQAIKSDNDPVGKYLFEVYTHDCRTTSTDIDNGIMAIYPTEKLLAISKLYIPKIFCVVILICDALRDLVPFVQFKKRVKHP